MAMNSLSPQLKRKLINSTISDFSLWCRIFEYRVEKSNMEIEFLLLDLLYLLLRRHFKPARLFLDQL